MSKYSLFKCIFLVGFWLIFPRSEGSAAYHIITVCHPWKTFILQYGYCKYVYRTFVVLFMTLLIFLDGCVWYTKSGERTHQGNWILQFIFIYLFYFFPYIPFRYIPWKWITSHSIYIIRQVARGITSIAKVENTYHLQ